MGSIMLKARVNVLFMAFFVIFGVTPVFSACEDEAAPAVNWANCDFNGKDFKNIDLTDAVLTGADFSNADFSAAILENADFNFSKQIGRASCRERV